MRRFPYEYYILTMTPNSIQPPPPKKKLQAQSVDISLSI